MKIIKSGKEKPENSYVERYHIKCNCGCVYECDWTEASKMEKSMNNAKIWFKCPECGEHTVTTRFNPITLCELKNPGKKLYYPTLMTLPSFLE